MKILKDHLGQLSPIRGGFDPRVQFGFVGRPQQPNVPPNPGYADDRDPQHTHRLIEMFGENNRQIFYVASDHSGIITNHRDVMNQPTQVVIVPHDAHVIDYSHLEHPSTIVLRTWDCGNYIVVNSRMQRAAVIHCSIATEFGYNVSVDFHGPISQRVMQMMGEMKDCSVFCGPAIGGIAEHTCWCYEFDSPDADTLLHLVASTHPLLSLTGITRERPRHDKTDVAFGELMTRIFESYGLTRDRQIDLTCNFCTNCEAGGFYSNRRTRRALNNDCSSAEKSLHLRQMESGFSNLACLHLT